MDKVFLFLGWMTAFMAGTFVGAIVYEDGMLSMTTKPQPIECEVHLYPKTTDEVHVYKGVIK